MGLLGFGLGFWVGLDLGSGLGLMRGEVLMGNVMVEIVGLELLEHGGRSGHGMGWLFDDLFLGLPQSEIGLHFVMGFLEMGSGFLGSVGVEIDGFKSLQHGWRSSELKMRMSVLLP
ncbi:LOW QUALITY PROTEIN: hypothetical protein PanWU01x14_181930 [Parasponia andersonii]|uniref:Uncharacterized protein n=1 Tax=Parasponia andersonii TaxID=3476 RepID=A0A2P5C5J9_PARAD|nr:LOW QUALITY PROTEIN: hypothetical protein PanWU01x14_181930 [Parasponia andersonii]